MFVAHLRSLATRISRVAACVRAFALLEDPPSRTVADRLPAAGDASQAPARQPPAVRHPRALHAHRAPLAPARRERRPGAITPRPALCLTPIGDPSPARSIGATARPSSTATHRHRAL